MKKVYEAIARGVARLRGAPEVVPEPVAPPMPPEHVRHVEPNPAPAPKPFQRMTPLPSKSRMLKLLREAFEDSTLRFQTLSDGTVQIWAKVAGISDAPIVSIKARDPKGQPAIYWMATCAAFRGLGFALEHYPDRIEIVPFREGEPKHKNSEILDA